MNNNQNDGLLKMIRRTDPMILNDGLLKMIRRTDPMITEEPTP